MEFLIVTTPSRIAFQTVRRLIELLREADRVILGVLENMVLESSGRIRGEVEAMGLKYLGSIPFDPKLEEALGDAEALLQTDFAASLNSAVLSLLPD